LRFFPLFGGTSFSFGEFKVRFSFPPFSSDTSPAANQMASLTQHRMFFPPSARPVLHTLLLAFCCSPLFYSMADLPASTSMTPTRRFFSNPLSDIAFLFFKALAAFFFPFHQNKMLRELALTKQVAHLRDLHLDDKGIWSFFSNFFYPIVELSYSSRLFKRRSPPPFLLGQTPRRSFTALHPNTFLLDEHYDFPEICPYFLMKIVLPFSGPIPPSRHYDAVSRVSSCLFSLFGRLAATVSSCIFLSRPTLSSYSSIVPPEPPIGPPR